MGELENYPIYMTRHEQEIIMKIIGTDSYKISRVWKQLSERKNPIEANSFESGVLTGLVASHRDKVPDIWEQLIDIMNKFRENAGVVITELGGNLVQLKDKNGITIIRPKYEWE